MIKKTVALIASLILSLTSIGAALVCKSPERSRVYLSPFPNERDCGAMFNFKYVCVHSEVLVLV